MESLDPDVFLTDVVDHPGNSRLAIIPTEEEDLEWVSNKDAFPAVETCILPGKEEEEEEEPNSISVRRERNRKVKLNKSGRKCSHCGMTKTTLWRKGPDGTTSLCNPCGLMYRSGRLCPEYRPQNLPGPANSPDFSPDLHSFRHKSQRLAKRVDKCTTKLVESKKDPLPADEILNTSEQPSSIIIAEQPSPISVLENSTNSTTTLMSSCGTLKIPHQPRSKGLHKRSAIPWQKVEIGRSCMMVDSENKCQNCRAENTTELMLVTLDVGDGTFITKNLCNACHQWFKYGRKKIGRKCQQCGTVETPLWQSDPLVSKTLCNVCQLKCPNSSSSSSSSSMLTKLVSQAKPTHSTPTNLMEEFYSWLKPGDITIAKPLNPVLVLGSSINSSTMTISSFGTSETPRRSRSKGLRRPSGILWQRVEIEKTVNTVNKCHVCNSGSKRNSLGSETLCNACYQVPRHLFNRTNNNPNKEISVEMEIGRKCQHCGTEETSLWRQGPLGPKTLCNACGLRWYKFRDLCPEYRPANSPTFSIKLHSNKHKDLTELRKPNILSRDDGVAC